MRDFQASADMMLDLVIGKKKEEAVKLAENFFQMIRGTAGEADLEALEEAAAPQDIAPYARPGEMRGAGMANAGGNTGGTGEMSRSI